MLFSGCSKNDNADTEADWTVEGEQPPNDDERAEATQPEPDLPPFSERLLGTWEFSTEHAGVTLTLGMRFEDGTLCKSTRGEETAIGPYTIVEDGPTFAEVLFEEEEGPSSTQRYEIDDEGFLYNAITPEVRYRLTAGPPAVVLEPGASGEIADGASGAAPAGSGSAPK